MFVDFRDKIPMEAGWLVEERRVVADSILKLNPGSFIVEMGYGIILPARQNF